MNKTTTILAILIVGAVLIGGYFLMAAPSIDGSGSTATPDELADQISQELIDETSTIEIGDMV